MIKTLLGAPDKLVANPRYRSRPQMRLWLFSRVKRIERTTKFAALRAKAEKRSAAGRAARERRTKRLIEDIDNEPIEVEVFSLAEVQRRAVDNHNLRAAEKEGWVNRADLASAPDFLDRITVNYIRHQLTPYDELWRKITGKVGVLDAAEGMLENVYYAIAEAYPELAKECSRQLKEQLQQILEQSEVRRQ